MTRSKFRRAPRLENLESRELLSTVTASEAPSPQAQEMLQILNMVRSNPQAAVQYLQQNVNSDISATLNYYGVNLQQTLQTIGSMKAQPPLAWSPQLAQAAQAHSQDMASGGFQAHNGSDGSTPPQRIATDGYNNAVSSGENVYAYASSVDQAMEAFLLDWGVSDAGHRTNILEPGVSSDNAYRDVGIGLVNGGNGGTGPLVVTQDFGTQGNEQAQVVGSAYNDPQGTGTFQPGSGVGGIDISAVNLSTGQVSSTQTWASGGYQFGLDPGNYQLIASQNGQVIRSQPLTIGSVNVERDINLSASGQGGSLLGAIASAQVSTPAASSNTPAASSNTLAPKMMSFRIASPSAVQVQPVASALNFDWTVSTAKKSSL